MKKIIKLILLSTLCNATGSSKGFFQKPIDYFGESKAGEGRTYDQRKFNWKETMNIESDEFFREGNYLPPAAFMELARRPTEQNIQNWISYQKRKQNLTQQINQKIASFKRHKNRSIYVEVIATRDLLDSQMLRGFTSYLDKIKVNYSAVCTTNCAGSGFEKATSEQIKRSKHDQYLVIAHTRQEKKAMYTTSFEQSTYEFIQRYIQTEKGEMK